MSSVSITSQGGGAAAAANDEKALIAKVAWRLMPLIMVCYLFAFFDRINISFAKFQLQADLSLSDTAYGLGAGLFVVGYVLFEVPSNMMLYKVGARRWIARIMMSWGIATALMVFVTAEWQFYVLRFIIGAMEAGFAPGVLYYLTLWFPQNYRGRITSTLFLASAFAGLIGAPVSGLVLGHMDGVLQMRGWHWLFLLGGIPCVGLGLIVLFTLKDRVTDAKWLTDAEKTYLASRIASQESHKHGGPLMTALKLPGFLMLGLIYFLIQVASYGLNFWAPQLIPQRRHRKPDHHRPAHRGPLRLRRHQHDRDRALVRCHRRATQIRLWPGDRRRHRILQRRHLCQPHPAADHFVGTAG